VSPELFAAYRLIAEAGGVRAQLERGLGWFRRHPGDPRTAAAEARWLALLAHYVALVDRIPPPEVIRPRQVEHPG
jgi:hypothetical protein